MGVAILNDILNNSLIRPSPPKLFVFNFNDGRDSPRENVEHSPVAYVLMIIFSPTEMNLEQTNTPISWFNTAGPVFVSEND